MGLIRLGLILAGLVLAAQVALALFGLPAAWVTWMTARDAAATPSFNSIRPSATTVIAVGRSAIITGAANGGAATCVVFDAWTALAAQL